MSSTLLTFSTLCCGTSFVFSMQDRDAPNKGQLNGQLIKLKHNVKVKLPQHITVTHMNN